MSTNLYRLQSTVHPKARAVPLSLTYNEAQVDPTSTSDITSHCDDSIYDHVIPLVLTDNTSQCVECVLNLIVTLFIRTWFHLHTFLQPGHPAPKESLALTERLKC